MAENQPGQAPAGGERAAAHGELRFRQLLDAAPDAMVIADRQGRMVHANVQTERLFGYSLGELMGKPVEMLVPEKLREGHVRQRSGYQAEPRTRPMGAGSELFGRKKDGSTFPVEISLSPFEDESGMLTIAAVRDISERKKIDEALRLSDQRFRVLVEEVKDYAIFMLDPQGQVLSWNEGARRIKGYGADEIVGQPFSRFYLTEEVERGKPQEELRMAGAEGRYEEEGWRIRKGGSRFWASVMITALRDADGKLLGFAKVTRDITERKRAREAFLLEITNALVGSLSLDQLLSALSSCLLQVKHFDFASLALHEGGQALMRKPLGAVPAGEVFWDGVLPLASKSPAVHVFKTGEALLLRGQAGERWEFDVPLAAPGRPARSGVWLPLAGRDGAIGTLNLLSLEPLAFSDEDVGLFRAIANQVALAVDNAMSFQRVTEQKEKLAEAKSYLEDEIRAEFNFEEIVGESRSLRQVLEEVRTAAPTDSTILILGETGTGKELLARAVHNLSPRREHTFVRVNCASIPAGLVESELFGHEKGAFTGALGRRIGRMELAHQGTLFLDEVGDIPLELQSKLLRALQEKEFERLGSGQTIRSDVRIVTATNRDLKKMVAAGEFRQDLFYRLNVFPLRVPPLRERAEDITLLARYFMLKYSRRMKKTLETIAPEDLRALQAYGWPGNIRELEHLIERAVILSPGPVLKLPPFEVDLEAPASAAGAAKGSSALEDIERAHIVGVLRRAGGRIAGPGGAAELLGMNRTTLNSRMRKLGISRKDL